MLATSLALSLILSLAGPKAAAAPERPRRPPPLSFAMMEARERLPLPAVPAKVENRPMLRRVDLVYPSAATASLVGKGLQKTRPQLCPEVSVDGARVMLGCTATRVEGVISRSPRALDLFRHRGIPDCGPDRLGLPPLPPEELGLGDPCPGSTEAGRGACLLAAGDKAGAHTLLQSALKSAESIAARWILGALAMEDRDPLRAAEAFQQAGIRGVFGRIASLDLCQLTAECSAHEKASKGMLTERLPEPIRTAVEMREIRREAYYGSATVAAASLSRRMAENLRDNPCEGVYFETCREVALAAMLSEEDPLTALELYVSLPGGSEWRVADVDSARAAALAATRVGAPGFAASLLTSVTRAVHPSAQEEHLRNIVLLYREAGDDIRAQVVLDYAVARGGKAAKKRWADLLKPPPAPEVKPVAPPWNEEDNARTKMIRDLADAVLTTTRLRRGEKPPSSP